MKRYGKCEFIAALKERGLAKSLGAAKRYVKRHPKRLYNDEDFRRAGDWLEQNEKYDLPGCGYNVFVKEFEGYAD